MPNNNFISDDVGTLPSTLVAATNDFIAEFNLRAARIADGRAPSADAIDALLSEGLTVMRQANAGLEASARTKMKAPLAVYRTNPLYARFANANLETPDGLAPALQARDALHRTALAPLKTSYVHIAAPLSLAGAPPNILAPQAEYQRLRLFLNEVRCIDETGSGLFGEMGSDETYLTFSGIDENGETEGNQVFKVRQFNDNTTQVYTPPKLLANFNIHESGDAFPKVYTGVINLMEHDYGSIAVWFQKVVNAVKDKAVKYITDVLGKVVGSFLGPLGAALGTAVGKAVDAVIKLIMDWLNDDNIGTKTLQATINSYTGKLQNNLASMTGSFDLTGSDSRYRVFYTWSLV